MTIEIKHNFISPAANTGEIGKLGPDEWNDGHSLRINTNTVIGRISSGFGNAEELSLNAFPSFTISYSENSQLSIGKNAPYPEYNFYISPEDDQYEVYVGAYNTGSGGTNTAGYFGVNSYNNDGHNDAIALKLARGTRDSPSAVQQGDSTAGFHMRYWDGVGYGGCSIDSYVDAAVSSGSAPTAMRFKTGSSTGAGTIRMTIFSSGHITMYGNTAVSGYLRTTAKTVSTLPSASASQAGARSFVTDATSTTFGSVVSGGGSNGVPVYSDGTNWRIG